MFQRLVQVVTNNANAAQSAPQSASNGSPASTYIYPDGSGSMGLPQGWTVSRAQLGDVLAKGPNGEVLRFGFTIVALDPTNPQSRALTGGRNTAPGNMVLIPYNSDSRTVFKSAAEQLAQKARVQPATMDITKTQPMPIQGGKNYLLFGEVDRHDGQGSQSMVAQIIMTAPQVMGG